MTDLEMTSLAAEAMGIKHLTLKDGSYLERPEKEPDSAYDGVYEYDAGSNMWSRAYNPLHDDAQVMALVRRYPYQCLQAMHNAVERDPGNYDLNRACVTVISEMKAAKVNAHHV